MGRTARRVGGAGALALAIAIASLGDAAFAKDGPPPKPQKLVPEKIVDGTAKNGMTWHVRLPKGWTAKKKTPGIVILHGSNMNGATYVNTIAGAWPKVADDFVIVGFDGEKRTKESTAENPVCNFTYVDFVGRSTFKGFPGTDRESPALVAEAMQELKEPLGVSRWYVGGHSQGAFLTYSVLMNYPELVAGAFPVSGGLIFQCEPTAYEEKQVRAAQRLVPLAIVHGKNDEVVDFGSGRYAYEAFEDEGFPALRMFTSDTAAHMFAMLPVEPAIRWLESMSSEDPAALAAFAKERLEAGEVRDACAAVARAKRLDSGGKHKAAIDAVASKADAAAAPEAAKQEAAIRADADDAWVLPFLEWREKFALCATAKPALDAYDHLRGRQEKAADELFQKGQTAMRSDDAATAWKCREELLSKYHASSRWRLVHRWLSDRK
jgi:predicted esterase